MSCLPDSVSPRYHTYPPPQPVSHALPIKEGAGLGPGGRSQGERCSIQAVLTHRLTQSQVSYLPAISHALPIKEGAGVGLGGRSQGKRCSLQTQSCLLDSLSPRCHTYPQPASRALPKKEGAGLHRLSPASLTHSVPGAIRTPSPPLVHFRYRKALGSALAAILKVSAALHMSCLLDSLSPRCHRYHQPASRALKKKKRNPTALFSTDLFQNF